VPTDAKRRRFRAQLADDDDAQFERHTDLCLVVENPDGSTLYVAGGRWDDEAQVYTDKEPETCKVYTLQPSQLEAGRWICWWLQERREGRPRDFVTIQIMGERGAGKTDVACMGLMAATLESPKFGIPGSIGWAVSKSYEERDEIDRALQQIAAPQWYRYTEERKRYRFPMGTITNVSADDPENLKKGRVDWLLGNEIQKLGKRAYLNALARLKDKGGCSWLTGNWPTSKGGEWLYDLEKIRKSKQRSGRVYPVRLVSMASAGNQTLDADTGSMVEEIIRDLDPRLAATDLDGLQMPVTDRAYWEWDEERNLRRRPDHDADSIVRDVTHEVTARKTLRRQGFDYVVGCDYQSTAHMVAVVHKLFGTVDNPVLWAVDEVLVNGTEEDLIAELHACGYTPDNTLVVGDGSGRWQDGQQRPGRTSFQVFRDARYFIVGPIPQRDDEHRPKNPKFDDRCRLHNWALKHGLYNVDPKGAPVLAEGLSKCELRQGTYGQGRPAGPFRHVTDGAGYPVFWLHGEKIRRIPDGGSKRLYEAIVNFQVARYRLS